MTAVPNVTSTYCTKPVVFSHEGNIIAGLSVKYNITKQMCASIKILLL